jgi:signal transduction histidine kinase
LGYVLMELSQDAMRQHQRGILLLGLAVTLGGVLLGVVLALRLSRRVTRPIAQVSRSIELIGQGQLSLRLPTLPDDPLGEMQKGLNQMAERLESHRDELESRVAEATLISRQKMEEAELATRAKSRFLAAASHDLRQPTHALGMFVARLAQSPQPPENQLLMKSLESSVQAMQDLLDGLLDVSRFDAGVMQLRLRAFALSDIFEQLLAELSVVAAEKDLRLRVRLAHVGVVSDPALLYRILLNLLSNALRYTYQGGVLLACRRCADGQHVRIEVWDSGIGIAPEHHEAIFREFYQVGNPERDRGNGLGLGLNIVERAAKLLEHRLQMGSRPGVGTRFSIEVPLAPVDAVLERRGALRDRAADNLTGLLVLLVEDDPLGREALSSLLRSWGCVVVEANGLTAALGQFEAGARPEVIVSDYRLPYGESGIEVIARLRAAAGFEIPACLISGDTDPGLMQAAKEAGLSLLHKPVRPAKLRSLLRRLVPIRQTERSALP